MKKTLFSLLLATVAVFTSNAAVVPISDVDSVYFDDVTLQAGTSKVIGAMLINKQEFAAFQLKILTPEQVNIVP